MSRTTSAELLLHPIRMRIVRAFLGDVELTTAQLHELLPDVPRPTLYRHVATLADAGVLEVASHRPVRGSTERTYRLPAGAGSIGPEEAATWTVEQHRGAFTAFVAGLLADFDRYLDRGDIDLGRDQVGYRHVALNLTDEEFTELVSEIRAAIARRVPLPPRGRTRRVITTVLMPAD